MNHDLDVETKTIIVRIWRTFGRLHECPFCEQPLIVGDAMRPSHVDSVVIGYGVLNDRLMSGAPVFIGPRHGLLYCSNVTCSFVVDSRNYGIVS